MKSTTRSTRSDRGTSGYVALHQSELMGGFARGFIAPAKQRKILVCAEPKPVQLAEARSVEEWGHLVLIGIRQWERRDFPLLLSDCVCAYTASDDAADEILARLGTFVDVVEDAIAIKPDPGLFPNAHVDAGMSWGQMPLLGATGSAPAQGDGEGIVAIDESSTITDKLAGALAFLRFRANAAGFSLSSIRELMNAISSRKRPHDPVSIALATYESLTGSASGSIDSSIFAAACRVLVDAMPSGGLVPEQFLSSVKEQLSTSDMPDDGQLEAKSFFQSISRLLKGDVIVSGDHVSDEGKPGQRAVMIFLLASAPEQLLAWFKGRKEVGAIVSVMAAFLSGVFNGIGRLPREAKGGDRKAFVGLAPVVVGLLSDTTLEVETRLEWAQDGSRMTRLMVAGHVFVSEQQVAEHALAESLASMRKAGLAVLVGRTTGQVFVSKVIRDENISAIYEQCDARSRLPADKVRSFTCLSRASKGRKVFTKAVLEKLLALDASPVVATLVSGSIARLRVEASCAGDAGAMATEALEAISKACNECGLAALRVDGDNLVHD